MHSAVHVILAIEPRMYREARAFSLRQERPEAEVSLVGSTEDHIAEVERTWSWRTRSRPRPGTQGSGSRFPRRARVSADGYSRSVRDFHVKHLLEALDRAEEELR
jgi:hypothetical protein